MLLRLVLKCGTHLNTLSLASQALGPQAHATMPGFKIFFMQCFTTATHINLRQNTGREKRTQASESGISAPTLITWIP